LIQTSSAAVVRHAWLGLCAVLAAGSLAAWIRDNPPDWLWHAATWQQHPWAVFTAAFVHLSAAHLLGNLLALAALALLGQALRAGGASALALLAAWPLGTAGLQLWPSITSYGGLSLVVHAGVAVLAAHCALRPRGVRAARIWALLLAAGLAAKLIAERAWQQPLLFDSAWGFKVAVAAHLSGALAGLACALLVAGAAWRIRKPAP
jgi:rhomboid family GlyGly-CTERM serine protease